MDPTKIPEISLQEDLAINSQKMAEDLSDT